MYLPFRLRRMIRYVFLNIFIENLLVCALTTFLQFTRIYSISISFAKHTCNHGFDFIVIYFLACQSSHQNEQTRIICMPTLSRTSPPQLL